jgi:dTDP-4-amino-4,6-dideoxy-D-galactose acyltransferase
MSTEIAMVSADPLSPGLVRRLPQSFRSYARYVPEAALRRYATSRVTSLISNPDAFVSVVRKNGVMRGLACWRKLLWDTQMFGFPAARLELLLYDGDYHEGRAIVSDLTQGVVEGCRAAGIVHIIARIDANDLPSLHVLEKEGFETIDGILTFSLRLPQERIIPTATGFEIRHFQQADLEDVLSIARSAYVFDRFHADPSLTREIADKVNETWVRSSCMGASDAVILACHSGTLAAYVTCSIHKETSDVLGTTFATIGMVATHSEFRGKGAGTCATIGALNWFQQQSVDVIEVGTQVGNVAASRLYESNGFRLTASHLTLRKSIH